MKPLDPTSNSIIGPYPHTMGYSYGEILECNNFGITLKDGRTFEFPFPSDGLRQRLLPGTKVQLKISPSGVLKEYVVIESVQQVALVASQVELIVSD